MSPLVDDIIVVDDGSADNTADIARALDAQVIKLPQNRGKGHAMDAGIRKAKHNTVLFCDGDMYGFSKGGIGAIVSPVLEGMHDMVIGIRPIIALSQHVFPFLTQVSGFRAMKKSRWLEIPEKFISGYQIELIINFVARRNDWHIKYADVPGLHHTVKEVKFGIITGLRARAKMILDIFLFFIDLYFLRRAESNRAVARAKAYKHVSREI
jgi:glycosyltransferase involved in cell wall biosynthesis